MSYESATVLVPASVATGAPTVVLGLKDLAVQVNEGGAGAINLTYTVEISLDGTEFAALNGAIGLTTIRTIPLPTCAAVRIDVTAYVAGTPAGVVAGDNPRSS